VLCLVLDAVDVVPSPLTLCVRVGPNFFLRHVAIELFFHLAQEPSVWLPPLPTQLATTGTWLVTLSGFGQDTVT